MSPFTACPAPLYVWRFGEHQNEELRFETHRPKLRLGEQLG
jgi:hypothetical protein